MKQWLQYWEISTAVVLCMGASAFLYVFTGLFYPRYPYAVLFRQDVLASAVGGCVAGIVVGLMRPSNAMMQIVVGGSPMLMMGVALIPKVLQGFWQGGLLWFSVAGTFIASGFCLLAVIRYLRGSQGS